jgi:hypothetical protein
MAQVVECLHSMCLYHPPKKKQNKRKALITSWFTQKLRVFASDLFSPFLSFFPFPLTPLLLSLLYLFACDSFQDIKKWSRNISSI